MHAGVARLCQSDTGFCVRVPWRCVMEGTADATDCTLVTFGGLPSSVPPSRSMRNATHMAEKTTCTRSCRPIQQSRKKVRRKRERNCRCRGVYKGLGMSVPCWMLVMGREGAPYLFVERVEGSLRHTALSFLATVHDNGLGELLKSSLRGREGGREGESTAGSHKACKCTKWCAA